MKNWTTTFCWSIIKVEHQENNNQQGDTVETVSQFDLEWIEFQIENAQQHEGEEPYPGKIMLSVEDLEFEKKRLELLLQEG